MSTLIAFGTIEGQTKKVARFVEDRLRRAGEEVVLFDTSDRLSEPSFEGVDKVILAASVHERRHPKDFETFVFSYREDLAERATLLMSVSLKAAFEDGLDEAQDYVDEMELRTQLKPDQQLLVAGAIRTESYDFYASQILRHVVLSGKTFDPQVRDFEFTDWEAVTAAVDAFLKAAPSAQA